MKRLFLLFLLLTSIGLHAQYSGMLQMSYTADEDRIVSVIVSAKDSLIERSAHLEMIVSGDTLNEYFFFSNQRTTIKKIELRKGEQIDFNLNFKSGDSTQLPEMEIDDRVIKNEEDLPALKTFIGDIWYERPGILFTIDKKDNTAEDLVLVVGYTSSYEYLEAYFKLTLIRPDRSKVVFTENMKVEWEQRIEDGSWIGRIKVGDKVLKKRGIYYFQIVPNFDAARVNGVDFISYEVIR